MEKGSKLSTDDLGLPIDPLRELNDGSRLHSRATTPEEEDHDVELDLTSVIQSAMDANFGSGDGNDHQQPEEDDNDDDLDLNDAINDAFKNNMDALLVNDNQDDEEQHQQEQEEEPEPEELGQQQQEDESKDQNLDLESVINEAINQNMDAIKENENIDPSLNLVDASNSNSNKLSEDDLAHAKLDLNAAIANALTEVDDQIEEEPEEEPKVTATQKAHEDDVKHFDNLFNDIQNIMGDINQKETSLEEAMNQVDLNEVIQKSIGDQGSYDETNELQRAIADALKDHSKQKQATKPKPKKPRKKSKKSTIDLSNAIHDALKDSNIVDSNENDFQKALEEIVHDVVENTLHQRQSQQSQLQGQLQIQHEQLSKLPKNDDLNWDSIMGNALQLAMNDEMLIDDESKKFKKSRNKKLNKNLIFIPDGTNRKARNQIQIKKFNNHAPPPQKQIVTTEMLINLLTSINLKIFKTTSLIQSFPTDTIESIKKSVSTSISSLMSTPSIPLPVSNDLPLTEKVKIDNRERKKRWREFNTERNRDLDLKTRVTKKALTLFPGDEHELLREEWINTEFEKRKEKRLLKEQRNRENLPFNGDNINLVPYELIFHDLDIINKFVNVYNDMGGNISTDKIMSSTMDKSVILSSISTVLAVIFMSTLNDIDDMNINSLIGTIVNTLNTFLDNNPTLMHTNPTMLPFDDPDHDMHDELNPESVSVNEKEAAIDELKKTMALQDELEFSNDENMKGDNDVNNVFAQENLVSSLSDDKVVTVDNTLNTNEPIENALISDSMKKLSLDVPIDSSNDPKLKNQMQVFKSMTMKKQQQQKKKGAMPTIDLSKFMKPTESTSLPITSSKQVSAPASQVPVPFKPSGDTINKDQTIPEKRKGDVKLENPSALKKALSPSPSMKDSETLPIDSPIAPTPRLPQYLKSKVKAPITTNVVRPLTGANIKTPAVGSPSPNPQQQGYRKPGAFKKPITFGRVPTFHKNVLTKSIVKKE